MSPVTPSARHSADPSFERAAWVWMSIKPGTTNLPRASIVSTASARMAAAIDAIRPLAIATSRIASSLRAGSMTRPPLTIRSYFTAASAGTRIHVAAPAAAQTNCRRFITPHTSRRVEWSSLIGVSLSLRKALRGSRDPRLAALAIMAILRRSHPLSAIHRPPQNLLLASHAHHGSGCDGIRHVLDDLVAFRDPGDDLNLIPEILADRDGHHLHRALPGFPLAHHPDPKAFAAEQHRAHGDDQRSCTRQRHVAVSYTH